MSNLNQVVKSAAPPGISLESFERVVAECQSVAESANTARFPPLLASLSQALFAGTLGASFQGQQLQVITSYLTSLHTVQAETTATLPDDKAFELELDIVSELEFVLLGSSSKSFSFKHSSGKLKMEINMDTSLLQFNQIGLLHSFVELALIVKTLQDVVSDHQGSHSLVALRTFLKQQLTLFSSYINATFQSHKLNFLTLNAIVHEWITKLKFLRWVAARAAVLPDHEFLQLLHTYTQHGDMLISDLASQAFSVSSVPYFNAVKSWMMQGKTPQNFFVSADSTYVPELVPTLLTSAFKIFQIGQTFLYINNVLRDYEWCASYNNKYATICDPLNEELVDEMFEFIVRHFNHRILRTYLDEISNLNRFLLLKQGDLINSIITIGSHALNDTTTSLSSYTLIQILQDSIQATSVKHNCTPAVYNRLDARLLNVDANGAVAWKLFTLDFHLREEISVLIGREYREYLRVFNFLIQIKRVEHQLSECWVGSNKLNKFKRNRFQSRLFVKFNVLRHQFLSFIHTVYQYILTEIIEASYSKFLKQFDVGSRLVIREGKITEPSSLFTLQDLFEWHKKYIESISRCALFASSSALPILLREIVEIIDMFCSMNFQFDRSLRQISSAAASEEIDILINERFKKLMAQLNVEVVEKFEDKLNYLIYELKNIQLSDLAMLLII